jgi:hypothetical protein
MQQIKMSLGNASGKFIIFYYFDFLWVQLLLNHKFIE